MTAAPIEILATTLFALAVLHTFAVKRFAHWAHRYPEGSIMENILHFLAETEVVFGLWGAALFAGIAVLPTMIAQRSGTIISKTYTFRNYYETMAFVNAVAFIAHVRDHHPTLEVTYNRCAVSLNTHDVHGLSVTDMECAAAIDALLKPAG